MSSSKFRSYLLSTLAAMTGTLPPAGAQQVLIDFDDGLAGNNRHENSVRNGGFEDSDSSDFASTPFWDSVFPEASGIDPTLTAKSRTGSQRSFVSGSLGPGTKIHLSQTLPADTANLEEGRVYTLSFYVRRGNGLENLDEGSASLEIIDDSGAPVLANDTNLLASRTFPIPADDSWGLVRFATPPIPAGSPFIGQSLRLRIQGNAALDHYFIIDDVSLTSTSGNPVPPPTLPTKPNIVIIYSDDVGYGDISANGSGIVSTPRIDSIATAGIRFTDGHSPASTCTPSRYSMLTGEYAWRTPGTGIANGTSKLLIREGSVTLPSMLRQAGYRTAAIGKWHLGLGNSVTDYNATRIAPGPLEIGFDYWFGIPATNDRVPCVYMENSAIVNLDRVNDPLQVSYVGRVGNLPTGASNPELNVHYPARNSQHEGTIINGVSRIGWMAGGQDAWWRDEDHADVFAEKTATYIQESVAANKPFFLYFASPDIHAPRLPHERFQGQSPHNWRGDALLSLDFSTGEILDQLEDPNGDGDTSDSVIENTLIIFTSDNGPVGTEGYLDGFAGPSVSEFPDGHDSNGVYVGGKYGIQEGGTRVPFFAQWPGTIPAGFTSDALVSHTDFMASFAALIGQALPADAGPDSENILPALLGQSDQGRTALITQNNNQNPKGVRLGNWKYFSNSGALHNLETDPSEAVNVSAGNPQVLTRIQTFLTRAEAIPLKMPLAAWWPFDGKPGDLTARDLSDFQNPASLSGTFTWGSDGDLPHLHFDGTSTKVEVSDLPATAGSFTLTTWARSDSPTWSTNGAFFSRLPSFTFGPVPETTRLQFEVTAADLTRQSFTFDLASIAGFDLQDWHHYAVTFDATTGSATLSLDGLSLSSTTFASTGLSATNAPLYLGGNGGSGVFAGDLSDSRIYDRALPAQRIANTASARLGDADGDGMLSDWEHRFDLNPFNPADADGDLDGDGESNLAEFIANTSPIASTNSLPGLISHWRFDEADGTIALDSNARSNGVLNNAPPRETSPGRNFLTFDGTNRSVSVEDFPDLTNSFTIACWAKSDTPNWNIAGALVSRRPQFILHPWFNSKRISIFVFDSSGAPINTEFDLADLPDFDLTEWHHYAGTYRRETGQIRLFIDGVERAETTIPPGNLNRSSAAIYIGRDFPQTRYLEGAIDEVMIYDLALTPGQLSTLVEGFDDDADGLDDSFERKLIDGNPNDSFEQLDDVQADDDPDGDGVNNLDESIFGTDPLAAIDFFKLPTPRILENEGSQSVAITFPGKRGRVYILQESQTLQNDWQDIDTSPRLATDRTLTLNQPELSGVRSFYRIKVNYLPGI